MLPVSLDCPLWIAPLLFSNIYLSCVPNVESVRDPWIVHSGLPLLFSLTFIINTKFTGDKGDLILNKVNGYTRIYAKYFVTVYFTIGVIAWIRKSAWRFGLPKLFECYLFSIIFSLVLFVIIKKYFCSKAICEVQLPKATASGYYSLIYILRWSLYN